jgi:hypothetical protein
MADYKFIQTWWQALLDLKLNKKFDYETITGTSISKASFGTKAGVKLVYDDGLNKALTFDDDMKDGAEYHFLFKNEHDTTTILISFPLPIITDSSGTAALPATNLFLKATVFWNANESAWDLEWGGAKEKKTV